MNASNSETNLFLSSFSFDGNINPHSWYKYIKLQNGKTDLISITLLSDIFYWYRPKITFDPTTGTPLEFKKKFKADLLQKSYQEYVDLFDLTKLQVVASLQRLEKLGFITRFFRSVTSKSGRVLPNVLFISLNILKIKEITYPLFKDNFSFSNKVKNQLSSSIQSIDDSCHDTLYLEEGVSPFQRGDIPPTELDTYTEITTETTTKNNSLSLSLAEASVSFLEKERDISFSPNTILQSDAHQMLKCFQTHVSMKELTVTSKRFYALKKILKKHFGNDLKQWDTFCQSIQTNDFLMGKVTPFKVTLDWVLQENNLIKIKEGRYFTPTKTATKIAIKTEIIWLDRMLTHLRTKEGSITSHIELFTPLNESYEEEALTKTAEYFLEEEVYFPTLKAFKEKLVGIVHLLRIEEERQQFEQMKERIQCKNARSFLGYVEEINHTAWKQKLIEHGERIEIRYSSASNELVFHIPEEIMKEREWENAGYWNSNLCHTIDSFAKLCEVSSFKTICC